ncbi:MAG TPA: hypothetical protein VGO62_18030 [Myxococcota bacterium]|jgi:hypothetical protein
MSLVAAALFLALATSAAGAPIRVDVYVPLCNGSQLACGKGGLGDPRSLDENLYWGARYGAERFLAKTARGFRVLDQTDAPSSSTPSLLREVVLERPAGPGERAVRLRLFAFAGDQIDDAVAAFFHAVDAPGDADVIVWSGHDRLMDVPAPSSPVHATSARVVVLACESEQFFGPALDARGAVKLAMTKTFMAPEAYLLEALASSLAKGIDVRPGLVDAYAKYQRISNKAAATVFVH